MNMHCITRRRALTIGTGLAISPSWLCLANGEQRRFKIGACDWSIGRGGQLSALELAKQIGSPAVQVYYDTANMEKQGYDIYKEIRQLGRERICQFHCKENGFLLGEGRVDFPRVKEAMDDIGYSGWLVIESAVGKGLSIPDSYLHNQKYLRSVFL